MTIRATGKIVKGVPCRLYKLKHGVIAICIKNNCFVAYWKQ